MEFSFFNLFKTESAELPELYPLTLQSNGFVEIDLQNIYSRILTDVLERTHGLDEKFIPLLWDNCLKSESKFGLVTLLAKAMVSKERLFLVYDKVGEVGVVRKATPEEQTQIEDDYSKGNTSKGVYISFEEFKKTDMLKIYSALEYCAVNSLNKQMNLSKAIQFKISDLRASVALTDKQIAQTQATNISKALASGKNVSLDAKDIIELLKPDLSATNSAMELIAQKQSFYLGMPASWITGLAPKGLGDSGEGDQKAVERGLKNYYYSIIKPVVETLFDIKKTTFKSEDFTGVSSALEVLKTFEITSDEYISAENKQNYINKVFGFPEGTEGDAVEEVPPVDTNTDPNAKPPAAPDPKAKE